MGNPLAALSLFAWLIIIIIGIIVRTIVAGFIDNCAHRAAVYKGYTESVDSYIFKSCSKLAYIFTIFIGWFAGALITFLYVCSLAKKGNE